MSFTNDWSDSVPIDHTQFKNIPSSIRAIRIDLEDRLKNIIYGFIAGETLTGIKNMPVNVQDADPGAVADQIKLYSKDVGGNAELFTQDEAGNVCQITSLGVVNAITLSKVYPIGSIYTEITGVNPNTTFGFGTWVAFAQGQVLVGQSPGDPNFGTVLGTGGEATHTLTTNEMPAHTHPQDSRTLYWPGSGNNNNTGSAHPLSEGGTTQSTGGGAAHNNLQPFIVVYFWRRTA